jgi:Bacterial aa3 type cytochrome c oxidase subunit IV
LATWRGGRKRSSRRQGCRCRTRRFSDAPDCPAHCLYGIAKQIKGLEKHKGSGMHIDPAECHPDMDYAEHQKTYRLFLKIALYTILGVAVLMALMAVFVV